MALLAELNDSDSSSDEEDEDERPADRLALLKTLDRVRLELKVNKTERKSLKKALRQLEQLGSSGSSRTSEDMGMEISTINPGPLFTGETGCSQLGTQSALRERRSCDSEMELSPVMPTVNLGNPAQGAGDMGGRDSKFNLQRADHSTLKTRTYRKQNSNSTRDNRAENSAADNPSGNMEPASTADSNVQNKHESIPTRDEAAVSSQAQNTSGTTATYPGGDGEQVTLQKLNDANAALSGGGGRRTTAVEVTAADGAKFFYHGPHRKFWGAGCHPMGCLRRPRRNWLVTLVTSRSDPVTQYRPGRTGRWRMLWRN